jgi:hypothetical protein
MNPLDDTRPDRRAPGLFTLAALSLPPLVLAQFFLVGLATFHDGAVWELHGTLGGLIALPILALAATPWFNRRVRPLRWWGLALLLVYVTQVLLAAAAKSGLTWIAALHPPNALILLAVDLVLVIKIHRSHSSQHKPRVDYI